MLPNEHEPILIELIRYNNWANAQVLAICQDLTADQLSATTPGAYGSIHRTIGHLLHAEADYVGRLTGTRPQPPFRWEDGPSLSELSAFAAPLASALLDAVRSIMPTQMVHEEEDGHTIDYQARLLFMQAIIHGIEHRTNVTTILNGLGITLPELDGWGYLFTHAAQFALKET